MASKNPIKGYIACPTQGCGEVCTVHAVGEHRVLEGGDPPKNKRRLGQLYTICPNCKANQSAGKPFQDWLTNHMKPTREEVATGYKNSAPQKPYSVTDTKPHETCHDGACEENPITDPKPTKITKRTVAGALAFVGGCALLFVLLTKNKESRDERNQ
ncbi:hypothetical protein [Vibrio europaeus]|uniref:hypothetical protein n=1 Tax=Vibrio europaeus TaxID=300876 RepID=UPI00233F1F32|nr:hypothetical protein [Vibrio europaeus]MDC5853741.1 hypothetical protein [Vibrio europaeus]